MGFKFQNLGMRSPSQDMARLEKLIEEYKPKTVIEIGSWAGNTAQRLAKYAERVYCIDIWEKIEVLEAFINNMTEKKLLWCKIIPCRGKSTDWAKVWNKEGKIDFLYIDGDHSYSSVQDDILMWSPFVRSGGIVAGHDFWNNNSWPGVNKAVKENVPNYIVNPSESVWYSIKK